MNIYVDKNSGFCFGVQNAVQRTMEALEKESDKNIYSYGELIHNNQVIEKLAEKGLKKIDSFESLSSNDANIIIRSHGISKDILDTINEMELEYIDCTCPFVSKIHRIVNDYLNDGYKILIAGDRTHPEVIGINGWCNNEADIIQDENTIDNLPSYDKICLVAQTTITSELWSKITERVKEKYKIAEIFNTRCNATENRQKSAEELSKNVDAMIVIGGYNSSNTRKLFEICKKNCEYTYHIETKEQLPIDTLKNFKNIGITAGASTPDWILKEVILTMEDLNNEIPKDNSMDEMEEYEKSFIRLTEGDTVKGTVLSLNDDEVIVNIGYKADGIIKKEDFSWDLNKKLSDEISIGDQIDVKVMRINDGEGNVVLSSKAVEADKNALKLEEKFKENASVSGVVKDIVKGGGIVEILGVKAFMPASLFDLYFTTELEGFKNQKVDVKIIEFDLDNRKFIVSRKAHIIEEKNKLKEEFWNNTNEGDRILGEVKRLTDFGAFVDIGGLDGLIHISELSWNRINHPSEVLQTGDKVEVVVLSLDESKNKVSLGLKQTTPEPWTLIEGKYNVGDIIDVKIVRFANFGAFAEIEPGIDGLIHISQISDERIAKPSKVLSIDETVKAKIIDINVADRKISLSITEAKKEEEDILE